MNPFEKGCLVQLTVSLWGGRVKIPASLIQVDADPALIKASKCLVERECLKPIEKVRNEARAYLYGKTFPFPIAGVLFIPRELIGTVDAKLKEFQQEFDSEAGAFAENYDLFVQAGRRRLNSLFNPADYPAAIRSKFSFSWRFLVLDAPGQAELLTPELYAQEKEKFRKTLQEFEELAVTTLRTRFAELVDHLVERFSGEKKVFRDSLIGNFKEFLADFEQLNINNDASLSEQVERCRSILGAVDPGALRSDEEFRQEIAGKMAFVQEKLEGMMTARPLRKIRREPSIEEVAS